jgi:carbon-monoxide dehydrogenase small subunit
MSDRFTLSMKVNGVQRTLEVHPMARLLDVLREDLGLTGAKEGCGEGECGACSVLLDGRLVTSCLVPAGHAQGAEIITVEGLAEGETLTALQEAFIVHNATQCGFCTPGMLLAAEDLLRRCPVPDEGEVRRGLAGNLCRCTGYVKIVDAVQAVGKEARP